jgi:hypothetical protein
MVAAINTISSNGRGQVRLRAGVVIGSSVVDGVDDRYFCLTVSSKPEAVRDA